MKYQIGNNLFELTEEMANKMNAAEKARLEQEQSQNPAPSTESERITALENWKSDIEESYVKGVNSL